MNLVLELCNQRVDRLLFSGRLPQTQSTPGTLARERHPQCATDGSGELAAANSSHAWAADENEVAGSRITRSRIGGRPTDEPSPVIDGMLEEREILETAMLCPCLFKGGSPSYRSVPQLLLHLPHTLAFDPHRQT